MRADSRKQKSDGHLERKIPAPHPVTGQEEPEEEVNCSTYLVRDLFLGEVSKHERHRTDL